MVVTHCDQCKKVIKKDDERFVAGRNRWSGVELCNDCGTSIREFLEQYERRQKEQNDTVALPVMII